MDVEKVLNTGQWTFKNRGILFRQLNSGDQIFSLAFDSIDFWVQVANLPYGWASVLLGVTLGKKVGVVKEVYRKELPCNLRLL